MKKTRTLYPIRLILLIAFIALIVLILFSFSLFIRFNYSFYSAAVFLLKALLGILIIRRDLDGDAKSAWLFVIIISPLAALLIYLFLYRPSPSEKEKRICEALKHVRPPQDPFYSGMIVSEMDPKNLGARILLASSSGAYSDTDAKYFSDACKMKKMLLSDLREATSFIFLEFYTVAYGDFWNEILEILCQKASHGVEVKIIYDGFGSITRLPLDFRAVLKKKNISSLVYSGFLRPNNRNHRKIAVIDGKYGYTGGINLADEYFSKCGKYGCWKDSAVRIEGSAVNELTYIFLSDWYTLSACEINFSSYYRYKRKRSEGAVIPFGAAPRHFQSKNASREAVLGMIESAEKYFLFTTPYLTCDDETISIIRAALKRGVSIKAIIPSIPDRPLPYIITKITAQNLTRIGVEVYEYLPGFLHSKAYISDGIYAIIGTVNMDRRSLVHNYEDGIWFCGHKTVREVEEDIQEALRLSRPIEIKKEGFFLKKLFLDFIRIFSPLF